MKKLLYTLIFFVCILASCFVTNSVFAVDIKYNDEYTYTIPYETTRDYHWYIFLYPDKPYTNHYRSTIVASTTPIYLSSELSDNHYPLFKCKDGGRLAATSIRFDISSGFTLNDCLANFQNDFNAKYPKLYPDYFNPDKTIDNYNFTSFDIPTDFFDSLDTYVCVTNSVVYDENDNPLFQGAPRPVEQVTIPEITQVAEIPQVITQVMKIMIPIGLIIFGIGLVIYLVRLVTSRVT